jgi:hypothetical protein
MTLDAWTDVGRVIQEVLLDKHGDRLTRAAVGRWRAYFLMYVGPWVMTTSTGASVGVWMQVHVSASLLPASQIVTVQLGQSTLLRMTSLPRYAALR